MSKPNLLFILFVASILGGCVVSAPSTETAKNKNDDQFVFPPPPEEPRYYYERTLKSSIDVVDDEAGGALKRALTGDVKRGEGLAKPYGVAVRHGKVFVTDTVRRGVGVFDIPGKKFYMIGLESDDDGHGKLGQPIGIDLDAEGNVYVLDAKEKQVTVFTSEGKFLRNFGNASLLYKPAGLAVTPDGSRVYAVDIGGTSSDEHKIVVFDGKTGQHIENIGKRGVSDGEFNLPRDVTVAPDGSLYVVDGGNFRVQKFDKDGKFVSKFGSIGRQAGQFARPKEAAVDPQGNVYVVDTTFGNFQIFNPAGELLLAIGGRSNSDGPALFSLPAGIAIDDDGRVYIVDQFFRKVDIFRPAALPAEGGWIGKFNPKKPNAPVTTPSTTADTKTTEAASPSAAPADAAQSPAK